MNFRKAMAVAIAGTAMWAVVAVPTSSAAPQARVIVRPYYPYRSFGYGFYGPRWHYPGAYAVFPASPATGEVKIDTHMKGGSIFVDGGFAGQTTKLKKFSLRPGNHDIEVRDSGGSTIYRERVQVILGKTTDIKIPS